MTAAPTVKGDHNDHGDPPSAAVIDALRRIPAFARDDITDVIRLPSMTNAIYRVRLGARLVVVRWGTGSTDPVLDRAAEVANIRVAAEHGLAPALVHADLRRQLLITALVEGRTLTAADARRVDVVERVGALLSRVHRLDAAGFRGRFDPSSMIDRHREWLATVGSPIDRADAELVDRAQHLCGVLAAAAVLVPCHSDPWLPNIVEAGRRLVLVDWEWSGLGDPLWDLTHFAVETDLDPDDSDRLLWAWCGGIPPREVQARLTLWRPVTDVVWGLWGRVQHGLGNRSVDLPAYAADRLQRAARALDDDRIDVAVSALSRSAATDSRR